MQTLRQRKFSSVPKLMMSMGLSDDSTLERIEGGKRDTGMLGYFAYMHAVGARADHVAALLACEDGDAADAAADAFLDEMMSGADVSSEDRESHRRAVVAIAEQLVTHPERFGRWVEYGERLLGGLDGTQ